MAVYTVFSQSIAYKYKTYYCSKATLILIISSSLTLVFPLIFTYKSHGFWLRSDNYLEQPDVSFKYDYVLIAETLNQESLIMCSNLPALTQILHDVNYCPVIKVQEKDMNKDGLKDSLHFSSEIALPLEQDICEITLILLFEYKISDFCRAQFEAMGIVKESTPRVGASSLTVDAELAFSQRKPLSPKHNYLTYNSSTLTLTPHFNLAGVIHQYSLRNVSARLNNEYATWSYGRAIYEPFLLTVNVHYSEATVKYTPLPSQVLKFAWMQFFPILVISILVFRAIKSFIFTNHLIYTYKEVPLEKQY